MIVSSALPLDPLALPLFGERLIEASAGTGKTYTIGILYLRLLLGLGGSNAYHRQLTVEEILVVTFTEAATKELRGRIRSNIHGLRIACVRGTSDDPMYQALLAEIPFKIEAIALLLAAERQMDEAAIYTIHGFCQKILTSNAFESGSLFEQTLIEDELPLRQQACADFWRRYCYPLPLPIARMVSVEWSGPEALLNDLLPWLRGEAPVLLQTPHDNETIISRHQQIVQLIDNLKGQWRSAVHEISPLITKSGVDKRSYSTRHLSNWVARVTEWAVQETGDYQLPEALTRFRQSILFEKSQKGAAPEHSLFIAIDRLIEQPLTLRDLIIVRAISEVRASVQQEKRRRAEMGFDDLLTRLDIALNNSSSCLLSQTIRHRYPVAMIDEFQDTDPQQYRIFQILYGNQQGYALLLIGDPKQAIYSFRGADIFTYIQARRDINAHYTLETNWRSSHVMVQAVNKLFHQVAKPFLFEQIPFTAVNATKKNTSLAFQIDGQTQPALNFWVQQGEGISVDQYQKVMAYQCAAQIRDWLIAGQEGRACLITGKGRRSVQAADISILVRNRAEAALVRNALKDLSIPSVYLSNRDSVFDTLEAKDLLWVLQAVLAPEQEYLLRSAIATSLLGLDARVLDNLNHNEQAWDALVNEFEDLRLHWQRRGVLPMLRELMAKRCLAEIILSRAGGDRRLTDVMHLTELLQAAAVQLDSEHALVRWLAQQIAQPNRHLESQQLRLESDRHLVQVITIHKSKGLEYPLVWLPFVANYREQQHKYSLFHDRHSFNALLDLDNNKNSSALAEEERLAEDLRLLYVALTRSVYHCSLGIAPLIKGNRKKSGNSDIHYGALGYLVQGGQQGDASYLVKRLAALQGGSIAVLPVKQWDEQVFLSNPLPPWNLSAKYFTRSVQDDWRVTSYSGLQLQGLSRYGSQECQLQEGSVPQELLSGLDIDAFGEQKPTTEFVLSAHSFPRGAAAGTFLHNLLESPDINQLVDDNWLTEQLLKQGLKQEWLPVLQQWLGNIVWTPLNTMGLILGSVSSQHKQAELQFYLPIATLLKATELDLLIKKYDPLSARCPSLDFKQVQGMLKGFIDLVFFWQGKFYLLDYKSNWLGEDSCAYTREAMEQAMIEHRYDLQYQLYTLALHRYLRHRLVDYDYQQHFGGVIYLFLRGIDNRYPGNGIFDCFPRLELVESLDNLFSGNSMDELTEECYA